METRSANGYESRTSKTQKRSKSGCAETTTTTQRVTKNRAKKATRKTTTAAQRTTKKTTRRWRGKGRPGRRQNAFSCQADRFFGRCRETGTERDEQNDDEADGRGITRR